MAFFCSLTADRVCFASMKTKADHAGLSERTMRYQHRAIEASGHFEAVSGLSGGRNTTRYRLVLPAPVDSCRRPDNPAAGAPLNPAAGAPEERKEDLVSTSLQGPYVPPADVPVPDSPPSQVQERAVERDSQTRMLAAISRKLGRPVDDDLLDDFAAKGRTKRTAVLDALLVDERIAAAKGTVVPAPESADGFSSLASIAGTSAPQPRRTLLRSKPSRKMRGAWRDEHQAACEHDFDKWGGCLRCGVQHVPSADDNPAAGTGTEVTA